MNVNLQVSYTQNRPHSQYLFYLVPQENLTTKQDWLLHPDYGQVRRLTCNLLVNLIKTNRITWYWSGGKQTNSLELEKPFLKLSINPKQILLPSSPYYKYPQETSHWTLCFFAPTTHVRVFERISLLCDHLAGLPPDSPYRLIRQKSLQCVGQRCKALVVPGFNALVVPAGFNALICQHIAPLSTTPPHHKT